MSDQPPETNENEDASEQIPARLVDPRKAIHGTDPGSDLRYLLGWAAAGNTTVVIIEKEDAEVTD